MDAKELIQSLKHLRKALQYLTPKELDKLEPLFMECDKFANTYLYYASPKEENSEKSTKIF